MEDQTQIPAGVNAKFIKEVDQLGGELNSLLAADFSGTVDRPDPLSCP